MKTKVIFIALMAMLFVVSCSDDYTIQLTQDEIVGDINTGKQVTVNNLTIYTEGGSTINVNGAKGSISAVSSNEKVVKVSCLQDGSEKKVRVEGISVGNVSVTVSDSEGNTVQMKVEVKDWKNLYEISRRIKVVERKCIVEGVSAEDSATIAADAIENDKNNVFYEIRKCRTIPVGEAYRLIIEDDNGNSRMEGTLGIELKDDYTEIWHFKPFGDSTSYVLATYLSSGLIKDVTDDYKKAYPGLKKAYLYIINYTEELEP